MVAYCDNFAAVNGYASGRLAAILSAADAGSAGATHCLYHAIVDGDDVVFESIAWLEAFPTASDTCGGSIAIGLNLTAVDGNGAAAFAYGSIGTTTATDAGSGAADAAVAAEFIRRCEHRTAVDGNGASAAARAAADAGSTCCAPGLDVAVVDGNGARIAPLATDAGSSGLLRSVRADVATIDLDGTPLFNTDAIFAGIELALLFAMALGPYAKLFALRYGDAIGMQLRAIAQDDVYLPRETVNLYVGLVDRAFHVIKERFKGAGILRNLKRLDWGPWVALGVNVRDCVSLSG